MQAIRRVFPLVCVVLILIFGLIHLGVSIGILGRFRNYGNVFRPERGIAGWNLVIAILTLATGIVGVFSVLNNKLTWSKITAYASIVLAFLCLISLIVALSINSLAITYVTSRFSDHMYQYQTNEDSRNIINRIQLNYDCCGLDMWLDWANVGLNATETPTTTTTLGSSTTTVPGSTTTAAPGGGTTAAPEGVTTGAPGGGTTAAPGGGTTGAPGGATTAAAGGATTAAPGGGTTAAPGGGTTSSTGRKKRQTQNFYASLIGLPVSFGVVMPQSCCTFGQSSAGTSDNSYCVSNAGNNTIFSYPRGCSKELGKRAVGQTLGISVINSFLIVIALATVVALGGPNPYSTSSQGEMVHHTSDNYGHGGQNAGYPPDTSYNNYNAGY